MAMPISTTNSQLARFPALFLTAIMSIDAALLERYQAAGQDHLFAFWSRLSDQERASLTQQLQSLNIERVNRIYQRAIAAEKAANAPDAKQDEFQPLPEGSFDSELRNPGKAPQWRATGLQAIARGELGVLLMAGGQGTRLGSSAPKGCYDIGLPSHKSLFQLQAERISRLQTLAQKLHGKPAVIPWYIMTSGPTRKDTEEFFEKHKFFGLDRKNVIFFQQGTLPCLTMEGKVLLDSPSRVAVAPDGNGGLYAATRAPLDPSNPKRTVLSDLHARGVRYIHAYGVDNCLVRVADPVFLGFCIGAGADCAAKVVPKAYATESVGVVALRGEHFSVVEYSEISQAQAERRDSRGELAFRAANIVNHFYTVQFLAEIEKYEDQLAYHIARKKIPHVDIQSGEVIKPKTPNGMKMEMFVFDVFPFPKTFKVFEVARAEEFSPLKNAPNTGSDDPQTSRRDLLAQHRRFLEAAGAKVKEGVEIEISPLVSFAGEGLEGVKGKTFVRSGLVESVEELDALTA